MNSNNNNNNNNNNKNERRRRLTFPMRRQLSYDRTLFNREMFYQAYNPTPTETASASTLASIPIIECPYSDEPYTYTGLSSPNLRPCKITTTDVSADGLLKPPSRNDQNRRRNSSPIGRDFGKEITENFLLSDNWLSEISRVSSWWKEEK